MQATPISIAFTQGYNIPMSIYRCCISDYDLKVAKFQNVRMKRK
jgi:hypothetical protein